MEQGDKQATNCWFAVCCKPRQERIAEDNLLRQDFHVYLPRVQNRQRRHGQWVDVVDALFPRYLFMWVDPKRRNLAPIRSTKGVIGLVRFGGRPAVVPNEVMNLLLNGEDSVSRLHHDDRFVLRNGERIRLVEGPFAGMEAVFAEPDGKKRAVVLLELLGKTNKVIVARDWLVRAA